MEATNSLLKILSTLKQSSYLKKRKENFLLFANKKKS
jgi:hypothetical protein